MDDGGRSARQEAGRTLLLYASRLSRSGAQTIQQTHPGLVESMGPLGVEMCERDLQLHAEGLAEALLLGRPELFSDGVAVTARALRDAPRGRECVEAALEALEAAILAEAPSSVEGSALEVLRSARWAIDAEIDVVSFLDHTSPIGALSADYLDAALRGDEFRAKLVVDRARSRDEEPLEAVLFELVQPALYETGRLWQTSEIGVADEHLVTHITSAVLGSIDLEWAQPTTRPRFLGVTAPGERHELGISMIGTLLRSKGWDVLVLGAGAPLHSTLEAVKEHEPDVVGVSLTLGRHVPQAEALVRAIKAEELPAKVLLGGQAAAVGQLDWLGIGADAVATDPAEAAALAAQLVPTH